MNVLITAANSAEAYQLKSKLNAWSILLGDYLELPEIMVKTGKMIRLPDPKSVSYMHEMLTLCLDRNINTLYVLREEEAVLLKESEQLFTEYGIDIVYPNL
ncbi:hypothetical protein SAMN05216490_1836 [Mucilaginibacter mallensis]|uniref:Uncharacterized protein n=1 Tax=Mucilaginibacter mallensis TaxID=652787 RepID=A0A1H1V590_MUCMA|nr:hypothetical protein [Mucilaginibacter mallensis]SDS79908.1 hypothetical protein SAMN05216490_1836 [Mucilaginibacter mallensis]